MEPPSSEIVFDRLCWKYRSAKSAPRAVSSAITVAITTSSTPNHARNGLAGTGPAAASTPFFAHAATNQGIESIALPAAAVLSRSRRDQVDMATPSCGQRGRLLSLGVPA